MFVVVFLLSFLISFNTVYATDINLNTPGEKPNKILEGNHLEGKTEEKIEEKNAFFRTLDDIDNSEAVKKIKTVFAYVFTEKNPIFEDYNHFIGLQYGHSLRSGDNLHALIASYSIPTKFFMNGRTTLEIGSFIGGFDYSATNNGPAQYTDVSQAIGGLMHEFVVNCNYFYLTAGIGFYIRQIYAGVQPADRIGSRFTFGQKFGIGKSIDRFNIELAYRHFSNGDLTAINAGYDYIVLELGYKF